MKHCSVFWLHELYGIDIVYYINVSFTVNINRKIQQSLKTEVKKNDKDLTHKTH